MSDVADAVDTSAQGPRKVTMDGMTVEQHPLKDQIDADRYLTSKSATQGTGLGIKLNRLKSPGAV